ncbi:Phage integrase family protein [Nitrosomonas marina]|uniref:Phage integrase family protein n=1 Tax=Nitrosomonas marina TaxID=917 RepID=A0A1I0ENC9_9PROT|nr:integrase family protein [Nitrosomonas marina]SET46982.1 Phage integrase family protein [Nitrosomonas marina]
MTEKKLIESADKVTLTSVRVDNLKCPEGKTRVYLWDKETKGFGIIATAGGSKSFIFQSKIHGKSVRITIGHVKVWSIPDARSEARRLQVLIDKGIDPRQEAAEKRKIAEFSRSESKRKSMLVSEAWNAYLSYQKDKMQRHHIERGKKWGERHLRDHENLSQIGGEIKKRGGGITKQGVLFPLLQMNMVEINAVVLKDWLKQEAPIRSNNARQGFEMFRAFWRWCATYPEYASIIDIQAVESKELRDEIPSRKSKKFDVLQRAHLPIWFKAVRDINNPAISAYLQGLLLLGCRREELAWLRWEDVDFQWNSLWIKDKVYEEGRKIPLTPYFCSLIAALPRRNEWVFSSPTSSSGRIVEPRIPHNRALSIAGLPSLTLHGLRRTFASLAEWVEMPRGVIAQIMGHAPSATAERHYIDRPLELLAVWHGKYEKWILEQAGIEYITTKQGLHAVAAT